VRAMRWRAILWRTAGPRIGRAAPRPTLAAYRMLTASAVRALTRHPQVLAVYANGSAATGDLRPGRSDVDLVAAVTDVSPERGI
jgi:predicted nucleotidyltransferase